MYKKCQKEIYRMRIKIQSEKNDEFIKIKKQVNKYA